jgi:hypothetical protein
MTIEHEYLQYLSLDVWVRDVDTGYMTIARHHSTSTTSRSRRLFVTMRDEMRERRRVRASYRDLERMLSLSSQTEVNDLLAMVAHQEGPAADRVRRVVARNAEALATHRIAS